MIVLIYYEERLLRLSLHDIIYYYLLLNIIINNIIHWSSYINVLFNMKKDINDGDVSLIFSDILLLITYYSI
jgi:hypothetical protein